ncbi:PAS domain-containing protein [Methylobacterium sp. E-005]|uniref:PAS domain-containing protein n=1 Tax=Methylobacterium sp. E-005 TaxID=2836549 RepID=UPI001FB8CA4A|nr:PAS domain-containing protein [Methylobacterium sp. E-005]MCJ2086745.1 PAS domain-containing protein [Methylobacterium sp. E-005]
MDARMGQRSTTRVNAIDSFSEPLDRLHAALDASCVVGTWDWDVARRTMVYDLGAARLLTGDASLAEQEITGLDIIAAVHPADHAWLIKHTQEAVRAGGLMLAEYRVIDADGQVHWLLSRGRTYHDATGQPVRSRGIIIDITELRGDGERYVVTSSSSSDPDMLERAADHAMELKRMLTVDAPADVRAATDLLLLAIGRALVTSEFEPGH